MAEQGWISKYAFQDGALAADKVGRSAVEDGFVEVRMLDKTIKKKLSLIAALDERLVAIEKALAQRGQAKEDKGATGKT